MGLVSVVLQLGGVLAWLASMLIFVHWLIQYCHSHETLSTDKEVSDDLVWEFEEAW